MSDDGTKDVEENSEAEKQSHPIAEALSNYVQTIDSLKESLSMSMFVIQHVLKESHRKYDRFVEKNCAIRTEGDEQFIIVPIEHDARYKTLDSRLKQTRIAYDVVPRSFLVALVSEYDAFLGRLLVCLFRIRPEMLNASERTLTFSQLSGFSSIEDAKAYVLEKEVETFLRQSHSDQFKWLEKKFDLPLRKDLPAWPAFIEITERRNLFVHAGGVVNSEYMQNCKEHAVRHESPTEIGATLDVPWKYFVHAHAILLEIGVKLGQVLWRKLSPTDIEAADRALSDLTYELLAQRSFSVAKVLLDFALVTLKKHASERERLVFLINRAQAYKWSGDSGTALEMLSETDWSATSDAFQLAQAVLTDDFGKAAKIMKGIGPKGYPHKVHYRDWPLFREFRKTAEFKTTYEALFGEATFQSESERPSDSELDQDTEDDEAESGPTVQ